MCFEFKVKQQSKVISEMSFKKLQLNCHQNTFMNLSLNSSKARFLKKVTKMQPTSKNIFYCAI